jgi:hypothetical protein
MKIAWKYTAPKVTRNSSPCENAPGIVIKEGGSGERTLRRGSRVHAFVYGEEIPGTPTLPFGRWKAAS